MASRRNIHKQKKKDAVRVIYTRFMLVIAFFVLWIGAIGVRLVYLQVNHSEWYSAKAQSQRRDIKKTKVLRGTIYDRNERTLAMSIKVKSLYADPSEIDFENIENTAGRLAKVLNLKSKEIADTLREAKDKQRRFVWLARKFDEAEVEDINKKLTDEDVKKFDEPKIAGVHWKEEQKRSYPNGALAAHIIGFANNDDIGRAGIEMSQEELLHGAIIKGWQDRDRLGRVYEENDIEEREPPKDIVLTISNSIQYITEQALEKGVKASNSKAGMAIVLDPKTGEILAMANYPTFDPNKFNEADAEHLANRSIQTLYSPGSVFKAITYGAALNENIITPDGMVDCGNGVIEIARHVFRDSHAIGNVTYTKALAQSSNVGAIKTGLKVGKEDFHSYAQKFGFGQTTGVELPTEARGILHPPERFNGDSLASMSLGYEVSVTALQAASAYTAIANGGVRIEPRIIKEIRQEGYAPIGTNPAKKTRVLSAETARTLRKMLRQVVLEGTGKLARLNGYTSAGKTGTAWKYDAELRKVNSQKYVSSFVGFAPVENPSVVIAVVMDEPRSGSRYGGQVAAPVFREIAEQILPELNVKPDTGDAPPIMTAEDIPEEIPVDVKIIPTEIKKQNPIEEIIAEDLPKKEDLPKQKEEQTKPESEKKSDSPKRKKEKTGENKKT